MRTIKTIVIIVITLISCDFNGQNTEDDASKTTTHAVNSDNNDKMETLMGSPFSVRGYIVLNSEITEINNQPAFLTGGGLNIVFNHKLNIGFEGMGMIADIYSPNFNNEGQHNFLQFGYGGVKIEPIFGSYKAIHLTVPVLLAAGAIVETDHSIWDEANYNDEYYHVINVIRNDVFFMIQPGVNLEFNLFKHFRLAAGAKYRFIEDVDLNNLKNEDFAGLSGNISLRFGWF